MYFFQIITKDLHYISILYFYFINIKSKALCHRTQSTYWHQSRIEMFKNEPLYLRFNLRKIRFCQEEIKVQFVSFWLP